ncbi:hypothetical protein CN596_11155 [Bacillus toyonensis]|uniref:Uncharacterized protein n=1 Tax=Bacillus toyonensis TaxID=155322 RepID=A0AB36SN74_9BACI|nr:hypothetical protein [Bacillus toyonensis]MCU4969234.1 hypothetical protein [Bacillus toyonensis]PEJ86647.1 hypothetical protein CN891_16015 [Bacillus toyonensis]PEN55130.1 hypothetical protein CN596_11155 [Bacillus toyonensis]PGE73449.1 hypothetical protein COM58_21345 [Bacillus toyonensis]PHC13774.1 hypothetical protein COF03_25835 [Bacillus toyonensis]
MKSEFTGFREELDKDFFPLLKDTHEHFETVVKKGQSHELASWYVLDEDGLTTNLKYNREIKKIRDRIVNTDVKQEDTIELKKNILNSLSMMESALKTINTFYKDDSSDVLWTTLSFDMDKLNENVEKQNKILGKYYK